MVPSAFVRLEKLPLSPTGKLDRRALPKPRRVRPWLKTPYAPPRNPMEAQIAEIWTQLLSVDSVGVLDNFFELGGHSLSHSAMISRLQRELRVQTPLQTLLECSTVAAIAARIATHEAADPDGREIAQIVDEVSLLSEDDAARLLADKENKPRGHDS
jgi:acyl carrier protein